VLLIEEKSVRIPGASISSTVGYVPVDWPSPGAKEGRHRIHFYSGVKDNWANRAYWIASIAHELGKPKVIKKHYLCSMLIDYRARFWLLA
jgi:hypothetical protein